MLRARITTAVPEDLLTPKDAQLPAGHFQSCNQHASGSPSLGQAMTPGMERAVGLITQFQVSAATF